ncbi:MAG: hypothetical protein MK510_05170 [SAR324 cluster bacterium]|nr:hypothetical protein [SAR324 cluster bacterium]
MSFQLDFFLFDGPHHARNATQRNATQRNATQRNATQRNATQFTRLNFCPHFQKSSFSSGFPIFLHFHQNQFLFCFIVPLRFLPEVFPPLIYERGTIALVPKRRVNEKGCPQ